MWLTGIRAAILKSCCPNGAAGGSYHAGNGSLFDDDLIREDKGVTSGTRMPGWDLAIGVRGDFHVARRLRSGRADQVFNDGPVLFI